MPRIPVREDYGQTPNLPTVPGRDIQPMPQVQPDTGGQEIGAAVERFGKAVGDIGGRLAEHAIKRQQEDNEKAALDADAEYRTRLLDITSNEKDGLSNRELDAAKGVSEEFKVRAQQTEKEILESIKNPAAKALADGMFRRTKEPYYSNIVQHEARQRRSAYDKSNESAVANASADADLFTTPLELLAAVDKAVAINTRYMETSGAPSEFTTQMNNKIIQKTLESAIGKRVDSNPAQARAILEYIRAQIDPVIISNVEKTLEGKFTSLQAAEIWQGPAQQFRRADGSYDTVGLRAFVDAQPDMSQDKRDKIFSDLNGRASQNESNYKQAQANDMLQAMNEAIKMQKEGVPIEEIKKQVVGARAAFGLKYQHDLEQDITKLFDNRLIEDEAAYTQAFWNIKAGKWTLDDLAGVRDQITKAHYDGLKKEYIDNVLQPMTGFPAAKDELDRIMDSSIGSGRGNAGKKRRAQFTGALVDRFRSQGGGTASQLVDLALEMSKNIKVGRGWFRDKMVPRYQVENPAPGTLEYLAVQRLQAAGKAITPESIQTVISRHPEWKK